jgi:phytoene dehydrogenase-like protein
MMTSKAKHYDVAVIGGGLAGLTAAIYAAKADKYKSVVVIEKSKKLGGLAQTTKKNGALFNFGPHAMYEGGAALQILEELDALPKGGYASKGAMTGIYEGHMVHMPADLTSAEMQEWSQLMGGLRHIDTDALLSISIKEWAENNIVHERVRLFFLAMCKQWSYSDKPSVISAGYVIRQGQLAGKGVRYIEEGWQKAVDQLHQLAVELGITFVTGNRVQQILIEENRVKGVLLADELSIEAASVIACLGPNEVYQLVEDADQTSLEKWKKEAHPLYAACLDVALNRLPCPERSFALGLDQPFYFGIHSLSVKLSENGEHVLHVMKYNDNQTKTDAKADKQQLIDLLNLLQPGWEKEVAALRFLPKILVAHDARTIHHAGAGPAPSPLVPEIKGLYVAGDWVGQEGRLADGAMASAKLAAQEVIENGK